MARVADASGFRLPLLDLVSEPAAEHADDGGSRAHDEKGCQQRALLRARPAHEG